MAPGGSHIFCCGRNIGTSFDSKTWFALDPCGVVGVCCSWGVHFYALIVVAYKLLSNSPFAVFIYVGMYIPAAILAMISLFKAWTTDPGAVPLGARPLTIVRHASSGDSLGSAGGRLSNHNTTARGSISNGDPLSPPMNASSSASPTPLPRRHHQRAISRCHKCNENYKPPRAHHDSVTGRCVVKFDHFCPWVGNAVGAMNHKFFCLFLFYTAITCLLSLLLLLLRTVHCGYTIPDPETFESGKFKKDGEGRLLSSLSRRHLDVTYKYPECSDFYSSHIVLGLLICSVVFLIFSCSMGCEQIEAVETGKGKIARMKMRVGNSGTEFQRVTEEFNEMFGGYSPKVALHWFLPTNVEFPRGMKKVVLGYEWDESFDPEPYEPSNHDGSDDLSSLGDQEMEEMEHGTIGGRGPPSITKTDTVTANPVVSIARDVRLLSESSGISDTSSVGSDSGIKNRKPPPKP